MSLTIEEIVLIEEEYFSSELGAIPAVIPEEIYDEENDEYYPSDSDMKCVYRTSDGRKCAVGVLFPDEMYREVTDEGGGTGVESLDEVILVYLGHENVAWLRGLQMLHDDIAKRFWEEGQHFGEMFLESARAKWPKQFTSI